jgi:hypothetical protein
MLKRVSSFAALVAVLVAGNFCSGQLYEQLPADGSGLVNQEFPDFPTFSSYLVDDVDVPAGGWCVDEVITYFTNSNSVEPPRIPWEGAVTVGTLNVFVDDGALDTEDPTLGAPVVTVCAATALGDNVLSLSSSGLGTELDEGTYWIGLTPEANFGTHGQEFAWGIGDGIVNGQETKFRNPGNGFALGSAWANAGDLLIAVDWDMAMTINGTAGACSGGGTIPPDSFSAFRGIYVSGDLDSLLASDDDDLCYNPGITLFPTEAPVTLDFIGTSPDDTPATIEITIESSANTVGLGLTFRMWKFTGTPGWQTVGTAGQTNNVDTVRSFPGVPADHVQVGTGEVRARYEVRRVSFIFLFPWTDCVDHVFWTAT